MPSLSTSKDLEDLINSLKTSLGVWEELVGKTGKFQSSVKVMTQSSSDMIESLHSVCDIANKSSCCLKNTAINLTRLVLREKKIEQKVAALNSQIGENFSVELEKCIGDWRKTSATLKREREHDWRKANADYQKSLAEVDRTEKKLRKKNAGKVGLSETANLQIEYANQDAQNKRRFVEDLERSAMRRAAIEERQRIKQFLMLFKPILDCQLSLREDLDNLSEVVDQLYNDQDSSIYTRLDELPEELEQNIQEHCLGSSYGAPNSSMTTSGTSRNVAGALPRSYSGLNNSRHGSMGSTSGAVGAQGSKTSLNSSTNSSSYEWNNANNHAGNQYMENMSFISHDSGIRSDPIHEDIQSPVSSAGGIFYDEQKAGSMNQDRHENQQQDDWQKTLTSLSSECTNQQAAAAAANQPESETEYSSGTEDDDYTTDQNSLDGIIEQKPVSRTNQPVAKENGNHNNQAAFIGHQENNNSHNLDDDEDILPPPPPTSQIEALPQPQSSISHESPYRVPVTSPSTTNTTSSSNSSAAPSGHYHQPLYPNQSIPSPVVYSNLQELRQNAEKKYGMNTLGRKHSQQTSEQSTSFMNNQNDAVSQSSHSKIPAAPTNVSKSSLPTKQSLLRRGSTAAMEMKLPETPMRGSSNQGRLMSPPPQVGGGGGLSRRAVAMVTAASSSSGRYATMKVRGRSMSVTRDIDNLSYLDYNNGGRNVADIDIDGQPEARAEDFNSIRYSYDQKIMSRINTEQIKNIPPPIHPKPEAGNQQNSSIYRTGNNNSANPNYMMYDDHYSRTMSSPQTTRTASSRILGTGIGNYGYMNQRSQEDGAAGESPAPPLSPSEFDLKGPTDLRSYYGNNTTSVKEDKFKQQLMNVLRSQNPPPSNNYQQQQQQHQQQHQQQQQHQGIPPPPQSFANNPSRSIPMTTSNTIYGNPSQQSRYSNKSNNSKYIY